MFSHADTAQNTDENDEEEMSTVLNIRYNVIV